MPVPAWLLVVLVIAVFVALACAGQVLVHRSFRKTDFIAHNEVAGFVIAVVGAIYAVLLAFLTVIVWQRFADAEDRAQQEADAATDVLRFSRVRRAHSRQRSPRRPGPLCRGSDHAGMAGHGARPKQSGGAAAHRARHRRYRSPARAEPARIQHPESPLGPCASDGRLAARRINDNRSNVPGVLWFGLIIGACTLIGFVYLFGLKNFVVHLLITAATATMIGLAFGLILALDYPFRGDVSVAPDRWIALDEVLKSER